VAARVKLRSPAIRRQYLSCLGFILVPKRSAGRAPASLANTLPAWLKSSSGIGPEDDARAEWGRAQRDLRPVTLYDLPERGPT
jgi:hypothetical protein